jgi:hypothetical protein
MHFVFIHQLNRLYRSVCCLLEDKIQTPSTTRTKQNATRFSPTTVTMLEAKLSEAGVLKKLLDGKRLYCYFPSSFVLISFSAIKELVTDANFECNEEGINLQAMDNSHVALVAVNLESKSFKRYRCDRPIPLGVNLTSLTKVLKCAKDDDECTLKAADEADVLNLVFEGKRRLIPRFQSRVFLIPFQKTRIVSQSTT